jgi:hypothetical protein
MLVGRAQHDFASQPHLTVLGDTGSGKDRGTAVDRRCDPAPRRLPGTEVTPQQLQRRDETAGRAPPAAGPGVRLAPVPVADHRPAGTALAAALAMAVAAALGGLTVAILARGRRRGGRSGWADRRSGPAPAPAGRGRPRSLDCRPARPTSSMNQNKRHSPDRPYGRG